MHQFDLMMSRLTETQRTRVAYLLEDKWVDDDDDKSWRNFDAALAEIQDPIELHIFANGFNWDGGAEELHRVMRHPHCDKATVAMIFLLSQPDYFLKHYTSEDQMQDWEREGFQTVIAAHDQLEEMENAPAAIRFDPLSGVFGRDLRRLMTLIEKLPMSLLTMGGRSITLRREHFLPLGPEL